MKKVLLLIILFHCYGCYSQTHMDTISNSFSQPIFQQNRLSCHPLGIFISRINHNFQSMPAKISSVSFSIANGNVWLPYVKAYYPINENDISKMSKFVWHEREGNYNKDQTPAKTMEFESDGIMRYYQLKLNFPIKDKYDFSVSMRSFSLDEGNIPYSTLTSDQFIEWFHSNISGGEDPFARKIYGYNKAGIQYTDKNGKTFEVNTNDFLLTGFEFSSYYYPDIRVLNQLNIHANLGLQLGVNTTKVNPSTDLGLNVTFIKQFDFNFGGKIHFGNSCGLLRQKIIRFGQGVEISNNNTLFSTEILLDFMLPLKHNGCFSLATTYFIQNSFNKRADRKYMVLTGERISSHWHYSISHLYRVLTSNYFIATYSKRRVAFSVYAREDLLVDNAPDVQTGISFVIGL